MSMAIAKEQLLNDLRLKYSQLLMQKVPDAEQRYKLEAQENWDAAKYKSGIQYLTTL